MILGAVNQKPETLLAGSQSLDLSRELRVGCLQRPFRLLTAGDLDLELFRAAHRQGLRSHRHEGQNCTPGDNRRDELDDPSQAVRRPPKDDGLHQMGCAARQDERSEEQEDPAKGDVPAAQHKVAEDAGNGHVGRPDTQVGKDVQPAVSRRPVSAVPARREARGVEQVRQEIDHETLRRFPVSAETRRTETRCT